MAKKRKPQERFTLEDFEYTRAERAKRVPWKVIARAIDANPRSLQVRFHAFTKHGLGVDPRTVVAAERAKQVVELRQQGLDALQISRKIDLSRRQVYRRMADSGMPASGHRSHQGMSR